MKEASAELLRQIVQRLVETLSPWQIYLFGSHAYGYPDRDSDIDLLVVVPDAEIPTRELTRRGRQSLWGLCVPVDLLVCTRLEMEKWGPVCCNPIHTVIQKGRLLYAA